MASADALLCNIRRIMRIKNSGEHISASLIIFNIFKVGHFEFIKSLLKILNVDGSIMGACMPILQVKLDGVS